MSSRAAAEVGGSTYSRIVESGWVLGSASALSLLLRLVRGKLAAILVGPAGVGAIGLCSSLVSTASGTAATGLDQGAARQLSAARGSGSPSRLASTLAATRILMVALGAVGAGVVFAFRQRIGALAFGSDTHGREIGWLALGVFAGVLLTGANGVLQGFRRIEALARVQVIGAIGGFVFGVSALLLLGERGVIAYVLATPVTSALGALWIAGTVRADASPARSRVLREGASVLRVGGVVMGSGSLLTWVLLILLAKVTRDLGLYETGLVQACWTFSGAYLGFAFQAMNQDYFPRLVGALSDARRASRIVREQLHATLALAGPILLFTGAFAGPILELLFSRDFARAGTLLRWLVIGDFFKASGRPLDFVILGSGRTRLYLVMQVGFATGLLGLGWFSIERLGARGFGVAFAIAYLVHGAILLPVVRRILGFEAGARCRSLFFMNGVLVVGVCVVGGWAPLLGYLAGAILVPWRTIAVYREARSLLREEAAEAPGTSVERGV